MTDRGAHRGMGVEVIGLHVAIRRSNDRWYNTQILDYDADKDMHLLKFEGASRRKAWYCINIPSRDIRWPEKAALPSRRSAVPPVTPVVAPPPAAAPPREPSSAGAGGASRAPTAPALRPPIVGEVGSDPERLLGRRVRVHWAIDDAWYMGWVTAFDEKSGMHHVHYDDGDQRWYPMKTKQFVVIQEAGDEVVGRRVAVEWSHKKWYLATIEAFDAASRRHRIRYHDGDAESANVGDRNHVVLVDTTALEACPQEVVGRVVFVYWVKMKTLFRGVFTKCTPAGVVTIVYDDGDVRERQLKTLLFSWAKDRVQGAPPAPGAVGLLNMGNTCYLAAVLQALSHAAPLATYCSGEAMLKDVSVDNRDGMEGRFALAFASVLKTLWGDQVLAFTPALVKGLLSEREPAFLGNDQHDAHEALVAIVDLLHEDLAKPEAAVTPTSTPVGITPDDLHKDHAGYSAAKPVRPLPAAGAKPHDGLQSPPGSAPSDSETPHRLPTGASRGVSHDVVSSPEGLESEADSSSAPTVATTSMVKHLLFMETFSEVLCTCGHTDVRPGPPGGEMLPSLPLAPRTAHRKGFFFRKVWKDPTLEDCIRAYFSPEDSPGWQCAGCSRRGMSTVSHWLASLPEVLVIHLKRFEFINLLERRKLDVAVKFPLTGLDMGQFVRGRLPHATTYSLFAVVNHAGGLESGHYTTFAKPFNGDQWRLFNDDDVVDAEPEDLLHEETQQQAYLLFYRRDSE